MLHDRVDAINAAAYDLSNALLWHSGKAELGDEDILQHLNGGVCVSLTRL
jgi:hypothetical protein